MLQGTNRGQRFSSNFGTWLLWDFSPAVEPTTIRVLVIALSRKWSIHQLDVHDTFLNGDLDEEVYMEQQPGFFNSYAPTYVCKLTKTVYGLKQSPRAWFHKFNTYLQHLGFTSSRSNSSMFIWFSIAAMVIFLVYVDDIIINGSTFSLVHSLITTLNTQFALKDLGPLSYFLSLEVQLTSSSIWLHQSKYV